jgi:spore maturation protein SpmB
VAMLVAIGVFRASGALDMLISAIAGIVGLFGVDTEFVGALPTAFMKPLSGSGARGMMIEAFNHYGVDSFVGRMAATFQGSTETTFYTIAVYYGAVGIRNTRYTVGCGLFADLISVIAGIFIAGLFFG